MGSVCWYPYVVQLREVDDSYGVMPAAIDKLTTLQHCTAKCQLLLSEYFSLYSHILSCAICTICIEMLNTHIMFSPSMQICCKLCIYYKYVYLKMLKAAAVSYLTCLIPLYGSQPVPRETPVPHNKGFPGMKLEHQHIGSSVESSQLAY